MSNEMGPEVASANFQRLSSLASSFDDAAFRGSYMAHHLRAFIADQIRGLRGNMSQKEFGERIGKPQSVVSRLESEEYSRVSMQTLIEIAVKLDIAFVGRFVDFPTFLRVTSDLSDRAVTPQSYNREALDAVIAAERRNRAPQGALQAFLAASYETQEGLAFAHVANVGVDPKQQTSADYNLDAPGIASKFSSMSAGGQSPASVLEPAA